MWDFTSFDANRLEEEKEEEGGMTQCAHKRCFASLVSLLLFVFCGFLSSSKDA